MSVKNDAFKMGREVSGPLFVPFCDWIVEETQKAGIEHVLFLARDGQLLKKVMNVRHPGLCGTNTHYCYAGSRASWYRCTPYIISSEILDFRIRTEYRTLLKTSEALGFGVDTLAKHLSINPDQELDLSDRHRVTKFCTSSEGRNLLFSLTQSNRDNLVSYLRQFGIQNDQKIAMVDVGWNGHFQSALEVILETFGIEVHGFYFGLNRRHHGSARKNFVYGPSEFPHWMSFYPCLIETLTPADHPTVSILRKEGNYVVPQFSGSPVACPELINEIHNGALSYADESIKDVSMLNFKDFVENPPIFAINVLSEFYFQKPFSPEVKESFVQKHSLVKAFRLSWSFKRSLDAWHWPQANLKVSGLNWLSAGLTERFRFGFKVSNILRRMKKLLSTVIALLKAIFYGVFDVRIHELVSFDIFDTLLYRRCGGYFKVFEELEGKTGIEGLAYLRKSVETQLLLELRREISLGEIYQALHEVLPENDWNKVKKMELEIEEANLMASARGLRSLRKARDSGATILFVSDMYMSSDWIRKQLRLHSIWEESDLLFVSSEIGANKRSGKLFDIIRDKYPGLSWKHSGDNLLADVLSGYRAGVSVKWLPHSYSRSIRDHFFRVFSRNRWLKPMAEIKVKKI